MDGRGRTAIVLGALLALTACGDGEIVDSDPPEAFGHPDEVSEEEEEHEPPPLSPQQMEAYYDAQITWRDCGIGAGLDLPEPPSLDEFVAEEGAWSVGADVSEEDWNRLVVDGRVDKACGEPPGPYDFLVSREALERAYAWHLEVLACLEDEGFPVETTAPPMEEFVEAAGTNWSPARDFHRRYGFPSGADWDQVVARCGNSNQDLWLQATDLEVDREALEAQYEDHLALTACLEEAGFLVPEPPPLEEFIDRLGWNWAHADIWGAVYRDNDRRAVRAFVEGMDQACPGVV